MRSIIVGVHSVRAVEVISPFDGFVYGFLDRHRLFSLHLLIRSGEDIGSHCETRSYAVRDLREVPRPWGIYREPPLYGKRRSSYQEAAGGTALFAHWIILYCKRCANFGGLRSARRRGGRQHTARLTVDEMDSFWRCHQEMRELLLTSALTSTRMVPAFRSPRDQ